MHKINTITKKFTEAVTIDLGQLPTVDTRIDFILTDGTNPVIAENKTFAMTIGTVLGSLYKTDNDTVSFRYLKFNDDNIADTLVITMTMDGVEILNDVISLKYQRECIDKGALEEAINAKADKATTIAGYGITDAYTKTEIDAKVASVYHYRGTVSAYAGLPASGQEVGDVWNIETADSSHGIKAGDNVAWTGDQWDVLAGEIDLSAYATKTDLETKLDAPATGTVGQVLTKTADGQEWADAPAGGGGGTDGNPDYLNIELSNVGNITLVKTGSPNDVSLEYSFDKENWTPVVADTAIAVTEAWNKCYFRGNNNTFNNINDYYNFVFNGGTAYIYGNVMSLIDSSCTSAIIPSDYCFAHLFEYKNGLKIKALDITLPSIKLRKGCYYSMFKNQDEIVSIFPSLPATELKDKCYESMFYGCANMNNGVVLPAILPKPDCYKEMFKYCNHLEYIFCNFKQEYYFDYYTNNWLQNAGQSINNPSFYMTYGTYNIGTMNSNIPTRWKRMYHNVPCDCIKSVTTSTDSSYTVTPFLSSMASITVSSALTLNASTVDNGSVAYSEIVLDVATGATVTAGTNLTLVDEITAGKRNICVCRWSGGTCKLYVTIVEDLPQA